MRLEKKILLTWLAIFVLLRLAMEVPHRDFGWIGFVNVFTQSLMALICYHLFRMSRGSQMLLWLNFTVLFGLTPFMLLSSYIGTSILPGDARAQFYTHLYLNHVIPPLMSAFTIVFIGIDYYFRTNAPLRKYLAAAAIAVMVVTPFLGRNAVNPRSIYEEPAYRDFRVVKWMAGELTGNGVDPTPAAIRAGLIEHGWDAKTPDQISEKVDTYAPYLSDLNYTTLFWRPVEISVAGVHAVGAGIIVLLLISIYRSGRPVQSYLDKILLGLGVAECLEVFHHLGFAYSDTLAGYSTLAHAGQYFTILILLALTGVLALKLRFLAIGAGSYYELAIAKHPRETTRLIDDIDKLVLTAFFPGGPRGTLAQQQPTEKPEG